MRRWTSGSGPSPGAQALLPLSACRGRMAGRKGQWAALCGSWTVAEVVLETPPLAGRPCRHPAASRLLLSPAVPACSKLASYTAPKAVMSDLPVQEDGDEVRSSNSSSRAVPGGAAAKKTNCLRQRGSESCVGSAVAS